MCDPILVSLLKMPPHYSQSSSENATPSSGTRPLASHKEVPPSLPVVMIVAFGIRNTAQAIRNPTNDWHPDPSSTDKESPVPGIWNPKRGIQDHRRCLGLPNMGRIVSCHDKFIRICNTSYIPWVSSKNCSFIDRMMVTETTSAIGPLYNLATCLGRLTTARWTASRSSVHSDHKTLGVIGRSLLRLIQTSSTLVVQSCRFIFNRVIKLGMLIDGPQMNPWMACYPASRWQVLSKYVTGFC